MWRRRFSAADGVIKHFGCSFLEESRQTVSCFTLNENHVPKYILLTSIGMPENKGAGRSLHLNQEITYYINIFTCTCTHCTLCMYINSHTYKCTYIAYDIIYVTSSCKMLYYYYYYHYYCCCYRKYPLAANVPVTFSFLLKHFIVINVRYNNIHLYCL